MVGFDSGQSGFGRLANGPGSSGPRSIGPIQQINMPKSLAPSGGGAGTSGGAPAASPAPNTMPYGQTNDPSAYGSPGAPGASPLGMWQQWLNTMGPYLAQMPANQPNVESGGLSSLDPSATGLGMRGYSGPDTPWQGNRGFRMLYGLQ